MSMKDRIMGFIRRIEKNLEQLVGRFALPLILVPIGLFSLAVGSYALLNSSNLPLAGTMMGLGIVILGSFFYGFKLIPYHILMSLSWILAIISVVYALAREPFASVILASLVFPYLGLRLARATLSHYDRLKSKQKLRKLNSAEEQELEGMQRALYLLKEVGAVTFDTYFAIGLVFFLMVVFLLDKRLDEMLSIKNLLSLNSALLDYVIAFGSIYYAARGRIVYTDIMKPPGPVRAILGSIGLFILGGYLVIYPLILITQSLLAPTPMDGTAWMVSRIIIVFVGILMIFAARQTLPTERETEK